MKATKLPSGHWRVQPSYTDKNGVTHRESFTHKNRNTAMSLALKWQREAKYGVEDMDEISFGDAMERFLDEREPVLSPNTFRDYKSKERIFKEY